MTIHLKRLKWKLSQQVLVKFPFLLDLSPFLVEQQTTSDYQVSVEEVLNINPASVPDHFKYFNEVSQFSDNNQIYELYGVINHFGSQTFGHYTAYCKVESTWFWFNDENVREVQDSDVVNRNACMLFYQLKKSTVNSFGVTHD